MLFIKNKVACSRPSFSLLPDSALKIKTYAGVYLLTLMYLVRIVQDLLNRRTYCGSSIFAQYLSPDLSDVLAVVWCE